MIQRGQIRQENRRNRDVHKLHIASDKRKIQDAPKQNRILVYNSFIYEDKEVKYEVSSPQVNADHR